MGRKSKAQQFSEGHLGQHLALPVAAHLARTQLVSDPLSVYDGQHLSEMLDAMARALAKVAPLYAQDPGNGQPRELKAAELEGATVRRGATIVTLRDGRTLSSVSIKRIDLRQAIAVLKAVGIEELLPQAKKAAAPAPLPAPDRASDALARLTELETLLLPPLVPSQLDKANALIVSIARSAPQGRIANLAMQLMSVVHEARTQEQATDEFPLILSRLKSALQDAERAKS